MTELDCPRSKAMLYNTQTAELVHLSCKSYSCPVCGPRRAKRLWGALTRELKTWQRVRFITLTLARATQLDVQTHYKVLTESFRYFIQSIKRRFKSINIDFKYIRINEAHADGYCHMHILINRYLPVASLIRIWINCVSLVLNKLNIDTSIFAFPDHFTSLHIMAIPNKIAVNYVVKYVTKSSHNKRSWRILYSKCKAIVFFISKKNDGSQVSFWTVIKNESQYSSLLVSLGELSREHMKNSLIKALEEKAFYEIFQF